MNFSEKRIIITGAAGFIGSNLTDALLERGAEVIGVITNVIDVNKFDGFDTV